MQIVKEFYNNFSVRRDWKQLRNVSNIDMTEKIIYTALKQSCDAVKYIPENKLTTKIIYFIIDNGINSLSLVPKNKFTQEIANYVFKYYIDFFEVMPLIYWNNYDLRSRHIPASTNKEAILEILKNNPDNPCVGKLLVDSKTRLENLIDCAFFGIDFRYYIDHIPYKLIKLLSDCSTEYLTDTQYFEKNFNIGIGFTTDDPQNVCLLYNGDHYLRYVTLLDESVIKITRGKTNTSLYIKTNKCILEKEISVAKHYLMKYLFTMPTVLIDIILEYHDNTYFKEEILSVHRGNYLSINCSKDSVCKTHRNRSPVRKKYCKKPLRTLVHKKYRYKKSPVSSDSFSPFRSDSFSPFRSDSFSPFRSDSSPSRNNRKYSSSDCS
jgi:hypothetical protein